MASFAELLAIGSRRRHAAAAIAAEPGGVVLASVSRPGAGAAVSLEPGGAGAESWRVSYFDQHGFSGHMTFASKYAAVHDALGSYSDINRNALREAMACDSFMQGVEYSFVIERENVARMRGAAAR